MEDTANLSSMDQPICSVPGCQLTASHEVVLYDLYLDHDVRVFYERHATCPYLCDLHLSENEHGAQVMYDQPLDEQCRAYRGTVKYPHTQSFAQGFVIYRPL